MVCDSLAWLSELVVQRENINSNILRLQLFILIIFSKYGKIGVQHIYIMNLQNPFIAVIAFIVCVFVFYFANTGRIFGKFVNKFFPCVQNPANSIPCYGHYDIVVMVIVALIGIIFLGILVFDLYKLFRP